IPKGEYGAGHVEIWDRGTYRAEKWRGDEVIATLRGAPDGGLGGEPARVALIRTSRGDGDDWLLHRMALPDSGDAKSTKSAKSTNSASAAPARPARDEYRPMLATLGALERPPVGEYAVEMKWDGHRVLAYVE